MDDLVARRDGARDLSELRRWADDPNVRDSMLHLIPLRGLALLEEPKKQRGPGEPRAGHP